MNIILPDNVFTRVITSCFPDDLKFKVSFLPSAQIMQRVEKDNSSVGLIPVMDLIKHKGINISDKYGISFEGSLCNSFIYYLPANWQGSEEEKSINKISLAGDVSSQEVLLSKILFKEIYGTDIEIEIITDLNKADKKNLLITGDENFIDDRFNKGISFSEIFVDTFSLPLVNYVFASSDKSMLDNFIKNLEGIEPTIYERFEKSEFDNKLSTTSIEYIRSNISSFIFKFDEQDREGINQILRLPYFHGMVNDITEVQFV